ncbi:MAG: hypothetical protein R3C12_08710 [Planctomycetaceae bacterium]
MNKLTPVEYLAQLHAGRANSHESVESVLDSLDFMSFPGSVAATTPEHLQNASDAAQRVHGELSPPQAAAGKNGNSSPAATCGDPSEAVAARGPGEKNDSYLAELFDRVNSLLGDQSGEEAAFVPRAPATEEAGLTEDDLERLISSSR